jgi:hypothetical protein
VKSGWARQTLRVNRKKENRFDRKQGMDFGRQFMDPAVALPLATRTIDPTIQDPTSHLRIERINDLASIYLERYRGLPPHD